MVLHDFSGHPFQLDVSRALAARGHQVLHVYCEDYVSGRGSVLPTEGDPPNLEIRSIGMGGAWDRYSPVRRVKQELTYAGRAGRAIEDFHPDVLITSNVPLFASMRLRRRIRPSGIRQVYWLQDLYSVGIASELWARSPRVGRLATPLLTEMEATLLRESVGVVAITEDFAPVLAAWQVRPDTVRILPNWAPIEELPLTPKLNAWSERHGYGRSPVVLYAGTLGLKHDAELLLQLARRLMVLKPTTKLVVVSEGPTADALRNSGGREGLENLDVLPFQPWEEMPSVLGCADVLVVLLNQEAGAFSVPSKVATYLCAGRPIVAAVPPNNLSARMLATSGAGRVVPAGDLEEFSDQVAGLLGSPSVRAEMGRLARLYAETNFDVRHAVTVFEELMGPARGTPQ